MLDLGGPALLQPATEHLLATVGTELSEATVTEWGVFTRVDPKEGRISSAHSFTQWQPQICQNSQAEEELLWLPADSVVCG